MDPIIAAIVAILAAAAAAAVKAAVVVGEAAAIVGEAAAQLLQWEQDPTKAPKSTPKEAKEVSKFKIDARGAQIGIIGDDAKVDKINSGETKQ